MVGDLQENLDGNSFLKLVPEKILQSASVTYGCRLITHDFGQVERVTNDMERKPGSDKREYLPDASFFQLHRRK